jgi:hypothetical protein
MRQSTRRHSPLKQWTARVVGAIAVSCFLALPAAATIISHSGIFDDPTGPEVDGDDFTLTNNPISEADIITLAIDLSFAPLVPGVSFDPPEFPFTPDAPSAALTGFVSAVLTGTTLLTLTFTDFNPNETFLFKIDVDDNGSRVKAINLNGALVTATFDVFGGSDLSAAMVAVGINTATWTNTAVVVPEPGTLSLLSLGLIGLAWESRRARTPRTL